MASIKLISFLAMSMAQQWTAPATRRAPEPKREIKLKGPSYHEPMSERRKAFIDAHNRNPLNFLPGTIVHALYRIPKTSQRGIEKQAHGVLMRAIANGYVHKPGYCGDGR